MLAPGMTIAKKMPREEYGYAPVKGKVLQQTNMLGQTSPRRKIGYQGRGTITPDLSSLNTTNLSYRPRRKIKGNHIHNFCLLPTRFMEVAQEPPAAW